jgi:chromate reductase, NAD(P)H dehydrogenase (quinone)
MITIISGTNRKDSFTESVSHVLANYLLEKGQNAQVLALHQLPSDFLFSDLYDHRTEEFNSILDQFVKPVDKFIFVAPEYNGSYPGVLKVFLEAMSPKTWTDKKALIVGVSDGHAGNLRGQEHLTGVLHYLKMHVHYNKPKLSSIEKIMNENRDGFDERTTSQLDKFIQQVIAF